VITLLHKAQTTSNKTIGIRKIVFTDTEYIDGDTAIFTNDRNINSNVQLIITTSLDVLNKYKNEREVLYFETLTMIEEYAIVRIERDILFFTFMPSSNAHTLFLTKRCNHYCLMCSEPPSNTNDDYLINENMKIIELLDKDLYSIGITGGEPTLLGKNFVKIISKIREELPDTKIRLLTNGRSFKNEDFVKEISDVAQGYLTSEIPLYNSDYIKHDYIVQSKGAFFESIEGFYNLAKYKLTSEVRVVLTKKNYDNLEDLIYFIYKNIPFIDHIALMGLEYIGFTLNNLDDIHISPLDYKDKLVDAIGVAKKYNLPISIYNLPLCLVDEKVQKYAKQSISDWKNEFSDVCDECAVRDSCSGMFTSTKPYFEPLLIPIKSTACVTSL